jgi:hypothetical protein
MNNMNALGTSTSMMGLPSSLTGSLTGALGSSGMSTFSMGLPGGSTDMLANADQILAQFGGEESGLGGSSDISSMMAQMLGTGSSGSGNTSMMGMPSGDLSQEANAIMAQYGISDTSGLGTLGSSGIGSGTTSMMGMPQTDWSSFTQDINSILGQYGMQSIL